MWSAVEDEKLMAAVTENPSLTFQELRDHGKRDRPGGARQRNRYARLRSRGCADDARASAIRRRRNKFTRAETLVIKMAQTLNMDALWVYTQVYKCSDPDKIKRYAQLIRNEDMILQNSREVHAAVLLREKVLRLGV